MLGTATWWNFDGCLIGKPSFWQNAIEPRAGIKVSVCCGQDAIGGTQNVWSAVAVGFKLMKPFQVKHSEDYSERNWNMQELKTLLVISNYGICSLSLSWINYRAKTYSQFLLLVFGNELSHVQLNWDIVCVYNLQENTDCNNSNLYTQGEFSDNEYPVRKNPMIFCKCL